MKIKYDVLLVGLMFLSSCGKEEKREFAMPEFDITEAAIETVISGEDELIPVVTPGTPLEFTDSTIVIAGYMDKKLLHVYDRHNGKLIDSPVKMGDNPADVVRLLTFARYKDGWLMYDDVPNSLKRYDSDFNFMESTQIPQAGFAAINNSFILPDARVLAMGFRKDGLPSTLKPLGMQIIDGSKAGNMISETPVDSLIKENYLYVRERYAVNPKLDKLVCGTLEGGVIETFNVDGNNLEPRASYLLFPYNVAEQNGMKRRAIDSKIGFSSIIADDNKIVAALLGDKNPALPTDITVWDWDCKPLRKYTTNAVILTMAFSPDAPDTLYAVVVEDGGDPKIVTYRCPGLNDCK